MPTPDLSSAPWQGTHIVKMSLIACVAGLGSCASRSRAYAGCKEAMQSPPRRLDLIQVLRAIAAILVLFTHSIVRLELTFPILGGGGAESKTGIRHLGDSGVDIFFVISGFIMLYVNYGHFQQTGAARRFLVKRILRIVPLYWLLTSLAVFLILFAPQLFTYRSHLAAGWVVGSYLFIPVAMESGIASPVVGNGWTLNFEMYFYLLFSVCLFMPRTWALLGLIAMFCISVALGVAFHPASPMLSLMTNGQLLEFLAGVLIAAAAKREGFAIPRRVAFLTLAVGCIMLVLSTIFLTPELGDGVARALLWGIPAALIVTGATRLSVGVGPIARFLIMLGDASYSIYLVHAFVLPACALFLRKSGAEAILPFSVMMAFLILGGVASGVACWYYIERPMTDLVTRLAARKQSPQAA